MITAGSTFPGNRRMPCVAARHYFKTSGILPQAKSRTLMRTKALRLDSNHVLPKTAEPFQVISCIEKPHVLHLRQWARHTMCEVMHCDCWQSKD